MFSQKPAGNNLRKLVGRISFPLLKIYRSVLKLFAPDNGGIVVLAMHKIGDSVFTVPAIKYLLSKNPDKQITVVCYPDNVRIYNHTFAEKISIIKLNPQEFWFGERWAPAKYRKLINNLKPVAVYDLLGSLKSFSVISTLPVKHAFAVADIMLTGFFDKVVFQSDYFSLIDPYLKTVGAEPEENSDLKIFPVKSGRDNRVLINPFGGWKAKEWNFVKFIKLYKLLDNDYDVQFIFQKGLLAEDILAELDRENIKYIESGSMEHLFSVTENCGAFISNDTGPLYVANLLGSPTFAIYGPTNPAYHKPLGDEHGYVQKVIKCSSKPDEKFCFTHGGRHGCPAFECMNLLSVEIVYYSIINFLKNNKIEPESN